MENDYELQLAPPTAGAPDASYTEQAAFEIARLLSVIADRLDTLALIAKQAQDKAGY